MIKATRIDDGTVTDIFIFNRDQYWIENIGQRLQDHHDKGVSYVLDYEKEHVVIHEGDDCSTRYQLSRVNDQENVDEIMINFI